MALLVSIVLLNDLAHTLVWVLDFMCSVFVTAMFNPLNIELNPICHLLALLGAHHILHVSRIRVKFWQHHIHLFHGVFLICTMLRCSPPPLWCTCFFISTFYCLIFFPLLFVAFGIYFVSDFYSILVWVVLFVVWSCIVSCFSILIPIVFFSHSHLNRESSCWNTGFLKYMYMRTLKWLHWIFLYPVFLQAVHNFHM